MYTIKQAAARAGLTVPVLRAWERRYGIVSPGPDAKWLPALRRRGDRSRPGDAPPRRHRDGTERRGRRDRLGRVRSPSRRRRGSPKDLRELPAARNASSRPPRSMDLSEVEAVLDAIFATGSFEHAVDRSPLARPRGARRRLGGRPRRRRGGACREPRRPASAVGRLPGCRAPDRRARRDPRRAAAGGPTRARRLAFAIAARRAGLPILYLGADLPIRDWLAAATRTQARAAVIGVVTASDREPAERVARSSSRSDPGLVVAFGGRSAPIDAAPGAHRGTTGRQPFRLPIGLTAAVDALERASATPRR